MRSIYFLNAREKVLEAVGEILNLKGFPEIVVGQGGFDGNFFFADGVDEVHGAAE